MADGSIENYGMIFSKTGVSPDPKKVQALKELPPPSNVATLRSFLGMMNYLSRFIKDFSIVSEPLRRLTKKDADWVWAFEQDAAFSSLKNLLVEDACQESNITDRRRKSNRFWQYTDTRRPCNCLCQSLPI